LVGLFINKTKENKMSRVSTFKSIVIDIHYGCQEEMKIAFLFQFYLHSWLFAAKQKELLMVNRTTKTWFKRGFLLLSEA